MLTKAEIQKIIKGQTPVNYYDNGVWVVEQQMEHAISQALLLNDGESVTLSNGEQIIPQKVSDA